MIKIQIGLTDNSQFHDLNATFYLTCIYLTHIIARENVRQCLLQAQTTAQIIIQ